MRILKINKHLITNLLKKIAYSANTKVLLMAWNVLTMVLYTHCHSPNDVSEKEKKQQDSLQKILKIPLLDSINKKLLSNPNNDSLYRERAYIYARSNKPDIAINDCKRAIKIDSNNVKNHLALADVYFSANQTKLSKDQLEYIIKKFPENTEAYLKLAELYFLVKQYDKSLEYINKALQLDETLAKGYYIRGNVYKEHGDTNKALSSLQTAIEQDPQMIDAYIDIAVLYTARKNDLALQYYNNALKINPTNTVALYDKAYHFQQKNLADSAINTYQHVLKINPNAPYVLYNLGAIFFALKKDNNKAIEYFNQAIQKQPDYAEAYYARGIVYKEMKNIQQAAEDFKRCLKIKTNYEPAIEELNDIEKKK